jgi:hypothetical protein
MLTFGEFRNTLPSSVTCEVKPRWGDSIFIPDIAVLALDWSRESAFNGPVPDSPRGENLPDGRQRCYAYGEWWVWNPADHVLFYPDICNRYLAQTYHFGRNGEQDKENHLNWMLRKIQYDDSMSTTKKHRWLGYVQGLMVVEGILTVDEEREFTRPIFNGA